MNTQELVDFIATNETGDDANDLLYCYDTKAEKRIESLINKLSKEMKAIKKEFPDACLIAYDYNIKLYLGEQYTAGEYNFDETPQADIHNHQLVAGQFFIDELTAVKY